MTSTGITGKFIVRWLRKYKIHRLNIYLILLLLVLQLSKKRKEKRKKCLLPTPFFLESIKIFKRILKYIIEKKYEEKKFEIVSYCVKKDIDLNKEIDFLNFMYRKHGLRG